MGQQLSYPIDAVILKNYIGRVHLANDVLEIANKELLVGFDFLYLLLHFRGVIDRRVLHLLLLVLTDGVVVQLYLLKVVALILGDLSLFEEDVLSVLLSDVGCEILPLFLELDLVEGRFF